jgi:uncharacterized protein
MQFAVGQQLREPVGTVTHYDIQERMPLPGQDDSLRDLAGTLEMLRTDEGLLVTAQLHGTVASQCSRCLSDLSLAVTIAFQEEFLPTADPSTGEPLPIQEDTDAFLIDSKQMLDLREAIHQYRMMVEPIQPYCQPNCLGLCPHCGYNLNDGPCRCPKEEGDSRWTALAELAKDLEKE